MDALVAEAIAVKEAFLNHAKVKEAVIESDCLNAIFFITNLGSTINWDVRVVIKKICRF